MEGNDENKRGVVRVVSAGPPPTPEDLASWATSKLLTYLWWHDESHWGNSCGHCAPVREEIDRRIPPRKMAPR